MTNTTYKKTLTTTLTLLLSLSLIFTGCSSGLSSESSDDTGDDTHVRTTDWSEETHSNEVDPNYDVVFNQSEVLEFNIVIDSADWQAMQDDLDESLSSGQGNANKAAVGGRGDRAARVNDGGSEPDGAINDLQEAGTPPTGLDDRDPLEAGTPPGLDDRDLQEAGTPPTGQTARDPQEAVSTPLAETSEATTDPIWVTSTITFNDITWEHVGIRFKGNSSLTSAYSSGIDKLSFKLDFDEFEDLYPEIDNQRFYGFKQLNLNNNYDDASLMREKIGADLFREFGLTSAQTTFAVVNVDYGEGSQFFGVYTLVEEIDDTAIESQYDEDSGNLYKPDGTAASFAEGTFDAAQMDKKNNEEDNDYSDVEALYQAINSDLRLSDTDAWKEDLEDILDVDIFLKWLAANTIIQNWDTYGNMTHNFYLYNNPDSDQLEWIPWDNNEAFGAGKGRNGALSLTFSEVTDQWPLIRYLIDDPDYKDLYDGYVESFIEEVFTVDKMTETYQNTYDLIKDFAYSEEAGYTFLKSDDAFDAALETLKQHVVTRTAAARTYLDN